MHTLIMLNNTLTDFKFHTKNYIYVNKKNQKHAQNMYTNKIHSHTDSMVKNLQTVKMTVRHANDMYMYNCVYLMILQLVLEYFSSTHVA